MYSAHIFREYDIRGIAGVELTTDLARELGQAFVAHLRNRGETRVTLAIGWDGRVSSPGLAQALCQGMVAAGGQVIMTGLVPTPALYFAQHHHACTGSIMVTGSHNPPDYNGFKMTRHDGPIYGAEIQEIAQRLQQGGFEAQAGGSWQEQEILTPYLQRLHQDYRPGRSLRVVLDCGNGVTGVVAERLLAGLPQVQGEVLFAEVDGTFPNHHPDPTVPKNLHHLRQRVLATGADLGMAFDGDGDRIGAVDEQGEILWADRLMILFARQVLAERPGATIIGDVKCSQSLFEAVAAAGGVPVIWKTGHSLVKAKLRETGAPMAGEMSGHLFFADRYYGYDDALYAAMRLIELAAATSQPVSRLLADVPTMAATPELRLFCPDDRKFQVMAQIRQQQQARGGDFLDIDGLRVMEADGWWLVRVSNTQPALVARVESATTAGLQRLLDQLTRLLAAQGVAMPDSDDPSHP